MLGGNIPGVMQGGWEGNAVREDDYIVAMSSGSISEKWVAVGADGRWDARRWWVE